LLQGEGNLAIHNNVFVNSSGSAVCVHPHNDVPWNVWILINTIVARDAGIVVRGADESGVQYVAGNAVIAAKPVSAHAEEGNVVDAVEAAPDYLTRPFAEPGDLGLSGKPGRLAGPVIVTRDAASWLGIIEDFEGRSRGNRLRGAYGTRDSPKWPMSLSINPLPDSLS
jgi:hypothetical protein